jgi:putative endonuclease
MENKRTLGSRYEDMAAAYLSANGLTILARNYRNRSGEIDIIAKDRDTYVFAEVKGRRSVRAGDPAEAVDRRKQAAIYRTAAWYRMKNNLPDTTPCRFDVIAILGNEIRWIRDAF